jgi:alkanesulfonate monooxygenase SsuD/methylene tetrahydromethanopterin reductase-like flavin-dependent oxidoreductase (luciferase family)
LGLNFEANDANEVITIIREAETAGVTQVWRTSGGVRLADIPTPYAAAATQTSRVRLGTSIVPIYPRRPPWIIREYMAPA